MTSRECSDCGGSFDSFHEHSSDVTFNDNIFFHKQCHMYTVDFDWELFEEALVHIIKRKSFKDALLNKSEHNIGDTYLLQYRNQMFRSSDIVVLHVLRLENNLSTPVFTRHIYSYWLGEPDFYATYYNQETNLPDWLKSKAIKFL